MIIKKDNMKKPCDFCSNKETEKGICTNCSGLLEHVQQKMKYQEQAKLRTKGRTIEEAEKILNFAAMKLGLDVAFEYLDSAVVATTTGKAISIPREEPRTKIDGYVIEDLDPIRLEVELSNTRQRVSLLRQLAEVDEASVQRMPEELERLSELERLVKEIRDAKANS
jgi:hypothetical protein